MNAKITTERKAQRMMRYKAIADRYTELMSLKGAQTSAVVKTIAEEQDCGITTCYKVLRLYKLGRVKIDKKKFSEHYNGLLEEGVDRVTARHRACAKFDCTVSYSYKIVGV
jgi:hypothetical protein